MAVWLCARLIFYSDIRQSIYSNPFLITEQKSISCSELMLQQMLSTQPKRETHPIYPFAGAGIPKLKIDKKKSQQSSQTSSAATPPLFKKQLVQFAKPRGLFLSARRTSFHVSYNTQVMPECGMTFRQLARHPR
jgi:hypothetical protein